MKKLFLFSMLCILATGCSKKSDTTVTPPKKPVTGTPGTVTINGATYTTTTIGSQTWTTQNYNGPGGNQYNPGAQDATDVGSFYSSDTFDLPTGWRLPSVSDYNKLHANFSDLKDTQGNSVCNLTATEQLISTSAWTDLTGSNSSGLNFYPAGDAFYGASQKTYTSENLGLSATLLTSNITTAPDGVYVYFVLIGAAHTLGSSTTPVNIYMGEVNSNSAVTDYGSVRFVKDN